VKKLDRQSRWYSSCAWQNSDQRHWWIEYEGMCSQLTPL